MFPRQTTKTTQVVLEEYKDLIENTKCDLENHLHDIGMRLQNLGTQGSSEIRLQAAELQVMEDEKNSTQKSLEICEQFLTLIEQSRSQLLNADDHPSRLLHPTTSLASMNSRMARMSFLINSEGLVSAQKEVTSWKLKLLQHLIGIDVNIQGQQRCLPPGEEATLHPEERKFKEEMDGTEALLEFCKQAEKEANQQRTHYFEDVSTGNNSRQAIVTTLDDLISAKRITSGDGSCQALGNMSDESIRCFFQHTGFASSSNSQGGLMRNPTQDDWGLRFQFCQK